MPNRDVLGRSVLVPLSLALFATTLCAQVDWVNVSPIISPAGGAPRAMTWDSVRQRIVLLTRGETWEWDGLAWYLRATTGAPPARTDAGFSFDRVRGRAVLFGGRSDPGNQILGDTWEWDGTSWLQRTLPVAPSPRQVVAMAWDPVGRRVLLFGGNTGGSGDLQDTWSWNGSWLQVSATPPSPALQGALLVYDQARGRLHLTGFGNNGVGGFWNFEWTGTTWRALGNLGLDAFWQSLTYDPFRRSIICCSGTSAGEFNGTVWSPLSPRTVPRTGNPALATDEAHGQVVLVSGAPQTDTWLLATDLRRVAPAHAIGSLPLIAQTPPILGRRMYLSFPSATGFALLLVGPSPCATPLANVDVPLFCAQGTVFVQPWIPLTSSGNPALVVLDLPADPAFVDLRACMQGMALESGNCLRLTDAGETRLRVR